MLTSKILSSIAILTCFFATQLSAAPAPEKIYVNGKVLTVDDQFRVAEAFAVQGGRFSTVGSNAEISALSGTKTKVINLQGRTVIPGLIDNHNHFVRGAEHWHNLVRLDGIDRKTTATRLLKQKVKELSPDQWVLVLGGWSEQQFVDDNTGFTREELDDIAPNRPAFIQSGYSHAYVNTAFLRHFNIPLVQTEQTEYPKHPLFGPTLPALIARDNAGEATALIKGGLFMVIQVGLKMPAINPDQAISATRKAQQHYHSLGLTSVYDPGGALINNTSYTAIETLHGNKELTLRTFRTVWIQPIDAHSVTEAVARIKASSPMFVGDHYYDTIAIGEAVYIPLHDSPGKEPVFTETAQNAVKTILAAIVESGLPAQIHAVNTATLDFYINYIEAFSKQYTVFPGQFTFTHGEGVTPQLLSRMQNLGITLQIRSAGVLHSRDFLLKRSGSNHTGQPPLKTINDSGVLWGLGTDGTKAGQINPMMTLAWAVTGKSINHDSILPADQLLTREQALIAHTRNNALLMGKGHLLGQIRSGLLADFVVIDKDYLTVPAKEIARIKPLMTVVDGKVVFQN